MKPSNIFAIGFFTPLIPIWIGSFLISQRLPYSDGFGWVDIGLIILGIGFWRIISIIFDGKYVLVKKSRQQDKAVNNEATE